MPANGALALTGQKVFAVKPAAYAASPTIQTALMLLTAALQKETGAALFVQVMNAVNVQSQTPGHAVRLDLAGKLEAFGALKQGKLMAIALVKNARPSAQSKHPGIALMK